jgi:creatinine amidohydrolase
MLFVGPDLSLSKDGAEYFGMDVYGFSKEKPRKLDGRAYWVDDGLFHNLVHRVLRSLKRAGFAIVVAHGHGPSTGHFLENIEQWQQDLGLRLFACWGSEHDKDGLGIMTDHAAANETSLMMALHPGLVEMDQLDSDPSAWPVAVSGEDPRTHASSGRGSRAIELQVKRMAGILKSELSQL